MVNLTKIYTRTGDDGVTRLGDNSMSKKDNLIIHTLGLVDSANAYIGLAIALGTMGDGGTSVLSRVQNELFDVGADLSTPIINTNNGKLRIKKELIDHLEHDIDLYNLTLEPLKSFVMPGGTKTSALLHVARTKVREAELSAWRTTNERHINPETVRYLNRLSDLLFVMARFYNENEKLWQPGGEQHPPKRFRDIGNAE